MALKARIGQAVLQRVDDGNASAPQSHADDIRALSLTAPAGVEFEQG